MDNPEIIRLQKCISSAKNVDHLHQYVSQLYHMLNVLSCNKPEIDVGMTPIKPRILEFPFVDITKNHFC